VKLLERTASDGRGSTHLSTTSIDPIADVERTILKLDPVGFAVREECYCLLIHERHVPHIEDQRPTRFLEGKELSELLDILGLHPATESEDHWTVCRSFNSEHKRSHA
jgi:hypothetical protein